jgi:hypothetical protein
VGAQGRERERERDMLRRYNDYVTDSRQKKMISILRRGKRCFFFSTASRSVVGQTNLLSMGIDSTFAGGKAVKLTIIFM